MDAESGIESRPTEEAQDQGLNGRMRSKGLAQADIAKALNISQEAVSIRLNPKTYERNIRADPFRYGDLLIIFKLLEATPEEKERLLTL